MICLSKPSCGLLFFNFQLVPNSSHLHPLSAARIEHHSPPLISKGFFTKTLLSAHLLGQLWADAILTTEEWNCLLKCSQEGWTSCVRERAETKATKPDWLSDDPLLKTEVGPAINRNGENTIPG